MQSDETLGDHMVNGFALPPTHIVGDAMSKFAGQLTSQSPNGAMAFSSFPQITPFHGSDRFLEAIPISNASIGTFPYPSIDNHHENTRYSAPTNGLDVVSSSLETMLHGYGGLPFPPELVGRAVGRANLPPPREWPGMEQLGFGSHSHASSQYSNELSLSLVTSRPSLLHGHSTTPEQCSENASSSSKSPSSGFKPFQMSGTRFLEAIQEILAEIACYALENTEEGGANASFSSFGSSDGSEADRNLVFEKQETNLELKRKHLLALLQMVDEQYSQCLDEIHMVTSAFHAVTELEPNLHARFALPTISFMYKSLRQRISSHILAIGAHLKEGETQENKSFEACFIQKQWALQQLSKRDHQLWRPQRGLPETSVSVLRTWMFQNFLHPYPKDSEKHLLALKSGLTRNQVSNWFINARVRLWKPMIEEMCAEMNRRKARKEDEGMEVNRRNQMFFETRRFTRD